MSKVVPISFWLGCALFMASAPNIWPSLPWQLSFWAGWLASGAFDIMWRQAALGE